MSSFLSFDLSFGIIGSVKTFQTFFWVVLATAVFAEGQPFERYQTIIDRKPFGPEPVNFDPEAAPGSATANAETGEMTAEQRTAEEQQLAANLRVSILNVAPSGAVKVGFTDSSVNPPENYYLAVGNSQNGWMVKNADPAAESVTLEKDGIEVTVKLGETTGGGKGGAPKHTPVRAGIQPAGRSVAQQGTGNAPAASPPLGGLARLRQRRMEMAEKERADAARKRAADAAAKAEQAAREEREAEEKQRMAEERAQQREALLQIQEQLRKQREEREAARRAEQEEQGETNDAP